MKIYLQYRLQKEMIMTGQIIDDLGNTITDAVVVNLKDKSKFAVSDINGCFNISGCDENSKVMISANGMQTLECLVADNCIITMFNNKELMPVGITQDENGTHLDWKHENVTSKMIDWFWSNMEKGYILWHPEQHEPLEWAIAPKNGNPIGSIHIAPQTWNDGVRQNLYIRMEDVKTLPDFVKSYIKYDHVVAVAGIGLGEQALKNPQVMGYRIHQWQATDSGVIGCSSGIGMLKKESKANGLIWAAHCREEIGNWGNFLPQLFKLYEVVINPLTNPFADLSIVKEGNNVSYKNII